MSVAVGKESFFWHKLHSLTGIVPIGFYLLQHLTLNSFSLAGPDKYNGVSGFFYSLPEGLLLATEILLIWAPLAFHAIYGLFITARGDLSSFGRYNYAQNRMYSLQRYSGIYLFLFLCYHVSTTTLQVKFHGTDSVDYDHMRMILSDHFYLFFVVYAVGVLCAAYHFCYGIWNFCIRWGITISDAAQNAVQRFSFALFVLMTILGWAALCGFFWNHEAQSSVQVTTMSAAPVADNIHVRV